MGRWKKRILNGLIMALLSALLFEVCFRWQVIDFYGTEFHFLNQGEDLEANKERVLVMGDSFTASDSNYVEQLRRRFPGKMWINGGVPGTGVIQAQFMLGRRFRQVEPNYLVYQIYLGNDLFDVRNPLAWSELGLARNVYWGLSNRFRSLGYLNYKMGQFFAAPPDTAKMEQLAFSVDRFNGREKMYLKARPDWLEKQLKGEEEWENDLDSYLSYLEDVLEKGEEEQIPTLLLIVPHFAQVNEDLFARFLALGAVGDRATTMDPAPAWVRKIDSTAAAFPHVQTQFLLSDFRSDSLPLYFPNDPHLNPHGQSRLADAVARWLGEIPQ